MSSIIHITNLPDLKKSIQILISSVQERIQRVNSAVIQIDLSFPQASPITTNPETMSYVIEELLQSGLEEITIIGSTYYNLSTEKIWNSLGYQEIISNRFPQVQFIPFDKESCEKTLHEVDLREIRFPAIIEKAELFICMVNPKASLFNELSLAIEQTRNLLPFTDKRIQIDKEELDYCEKNLYLKNYIQEVVETHLIRRPDLVIYDFTTILSHAGPTLFVDSQYMYSDLLMISDNSIIGDCLALSLFNFDPDNNLLIEAVKNYDYSLISQEIMDDCSITIFEMDDLGEIHQEDAGYLLKKSDNENKRSFKFRKRKDKEEKEESITKIDTIESFIDMVDVFPQKFEICKGIKCSGCSKAALELLLFLKTIMQKDQESLPMISFLVGKNPVEPKNEYCIVFGDHAITSTQNRKFREKLITRTVRSDEELDLDRAKLKIRLQKKVVELESHHDVIKQELPEGSKRERINQRLDRKIVRMQKFHEYRMKAYENFLKQRQKREKRLLERDETTKNFHVLELPGCPPEPITCFRDIIKLLKKRWVPGLELHTQFLQEFLHDQMESKSNQDQEIEQEEITK